MLDNCLKKPKELEIKRFIFLSLLDVRTILHRVFLRWIGESGGRHFLLALNNLPYRIGGDGHFRSILSSTCQARCHIVSRIPVMTCRTEQLNLSERGLEYIFTKTPKGELSFQGLPVFQVLAQSFLEVKFLNFNLLNGAISMRSLDRMCSWYTSK